MDMTFLETTLCGLAAGAAGALLMNLFLRWISATFAEPVNMIEVLGSFFTGSRRNAIQLGTFIHLASGALFGTIYSWILTFLGAAVLPIPLFTGMGLGFFHGLLVSYILMAFVGQSHPVEAFRQSSLMVGVLYLISHILYGGFVGLAVGLLTLAVS